MKKKVKALGLISGGLDSALAAYIIKAQGVEVHAVGFESPFFNSLRAQRMAEELAISFRSIAIHTQIIEILKAPRFGYGKGMNVCIDCHILMIQKAGECMSAEGFDFVFTGEVRGQRPMSQNTQALQLVEKQSGIAGFLVRPLSAQLLDPTVPEQSGVIDRNKLLGISGRSRKVQMALAAEYGITSYSTPAGGCLLTDPHFSKRIKLFLTAFGGITSDQAAILRIGRFLRLQERVFLIVGRDQVENALLQAFADRSVYFRTISVPGPEALLLHSENPSDMIIEYAARICARYADIQADVPVTIVVHNAGREMQLDVCALEDGNVRQWLVV